MWNKERYTIGEVAALLNISPQTLRFYDKQGVVVPHCTDQKTGYRYYHYDQISYIDRVKYLQRFGFRLEDIRDALASNDVAQFKTFLLRRRETLRKEAETLNALLEDLEWYLAYYEHLDLRDFDDLPYKVKELERCILAEPLEPGEYIYGTAGERLTRLQHSRTFSHTAFLRQHGYLLDYPALLRGEVVPTHYFVYLRQKPALEHPKIRTLPAGDYFCMQSRILAEPFDSTYVRRYFQNRSPGVVVASEYEDNFTSFQDCIYEVQILRLPLR